MYIFPIPLRKDGIDGPYTNSYSMKSTSKVCKASLEYLCRRGNTFCKHLALWERNYIRLGARSKGTKRNCSQTNYGIVNNVKQSANKQHPLSQFFSLETSTCHLCSSKNLSCTFRRYEQRKANGLLRLTLFEILLCIFWPCDYTTQ